ncbi:T9SS type A sorting domain-containing protein [Chryseobacterium sp. JM1]|uniref:T9SS type A sorting domain-containing protein n=1 Tax=Chryseobacterium sp. JM1 TaxID=1233950 RepID=UPI0004E6E5F7|nr:T9SS type A sorting domain-containing protein [Chryseobacterium sp. JM1]KFF21803.1 hypothetical protein IW22_07670 [Chryseobacterium sp. JM1]
MKKLLLPAAIIVGTLFHAQNTELTDTTWYLKKIIKNNVTYNVPQNTEMVTPTLTFTLPSVSSPAYSMNSYICGTSIWAVVYQIEITASAFGLWASGVGNQTCTNPENITFFNHYSNYFEYNSGLFNYQITYSGNTKNMVVDNNYGVQAFYESGFLTTKELEASKAASIKIYPNPVKDSFLEIKGVERIEWTKIYNAEGRLVQQNSADSRIDVSGLSRGGYFLEIKSQKGISRHQFIRE